MEEELSSKKNFFFDIERTLWNWDSTVIGAEDTVKSLRSKDRNVFFHTDNTLLTRKQLSERLSRYGIPASESQVMTSGYVTAKELERKDVNKAYVIGESGLMNEVEERDIQVTDEANKVVVGLDRQFNYTKLQKAMDIVNDGGEIIYCSTEKIFRKSESIHPHQGIINESLKEIDGGRLFGKPSEIFREHFKEYFSYYPKKSVFIGDRLADIETGNRLGMTTFAVLSGEIDKDKLKKADEIQKPDYGLSSLSKLKRKIL